MKKLRITNYILFALSAIIEVISIITFVNTLKLVMSDSIAVIAIIATIPVYVLATVAIFILAIITSIIYKSLIKKLNEQQLPISKTDKIFKILPWVFVLINIILFISLYIL